MTHKDIKTKFMIEYDKANVTSSYPSLTDYETATILDKAYNALIAQKVTGNNMRRSGFESDIKSISDLQPLVVIWNQKQLYEAYNTAVYNIPTDFLYFVNAYLGQHLDNPMDNIQSRVVNVQIVDHQTADKFIINDHNMPWIKHPVAYIEDNKIHVIYDSYNKPDTDHLSLTYIKQPQKFVKEDLFDDTEFELNDTMAEELITLAITFALENIESTRLASKLNTRGLEA